MREVKQGLDITWPLQGMPAPERGACSATINAVRGYCIRDSKPTDESRYYLSNLLTGAKALLQNVWDRSSIENS